MSKSPMQAIKQFCADCIYDPGCAGNGSMYEQIEGCTDTKCALYDCRPLTGKTKQATRQEIIDQMSPEELELHKERVRQASIRFGHIPSVVTR